MARLKRFELLTHCLEGSCSIRLSYRRVCGAGDGNRTHAASLEGWNSTIELHPPVVRFKTAIQSYHKALLLSRVISKKLRFFCKIAPFGIRGAFFLVGTCQKYRYYVKII